MNRISLVANCLFLAATLVTAAWSDDHPIREELFHSFRNYYEARGGRERIESGTSEQTDQYYAALAAKLRFPGQRIPETLDDLLKWFGCDTPAAELEHATPRDLNAAGSVISARYFSPKTTDVSRRERQQRLSWRKVMLIPSKAGSPAAAAGMQQMWWLTNVYSEATTNPFEVASQNNQIILVPSQPLELSVQWKPGEPPQLERHSLVFAVYQARSNDPTTSYHWTRYTSTTWDGGTANPNQPGDPSTNYYVPTSCIQCHGQEFPKARLNLFDTDYYLWRSADHDDYPGLSQIKWWKGNAQHWWLGDVEGFEYEAFKKLNDAIHVQNQVIDGVGADPSFQTKSIQGWLNAHRKDLSEVAPSARGWNGQHTELVDLLVKHCSRCHGTVGYSVLNPEQVQSNAEWMADRIANKDPVERMPQDRVVFPPELAEERNPDVVKELQRLQELLRKLAN